MGLSDEIKMGGAFESFRHEALLNLMKTTHSIQKRSNAFFSEYGISDAQYNVLIVLKIAGEGLTQVDIGQRVVASRSNITALIDRLEKKNYVKRCVVEGDRRSYKVELAADGVKLLDSVEKLYLDEVESVMTCLTEKESKQLSSIMEKLRNHIS